MARHLNIKTEKYLSLSKFIKNNLKAENSSTYDNLSFSSNLESSDGINIVTRDRKMFY